MDNTYKRGDTVNIVGTLALILDNGTPGSDFRKTHLGKSIKWYEPSREHVITVDVGASLYRSWIGPTANEVYYTIMIGDEQAWISNGYLKRIEELTKDV